MYPQTIFEIDDQSAVVSSIPNDTIYLYEMMVSSTSKGPEDMRYVAGDKFYKLYGSDISFAKHGQPLIQATNVIENGGGLLFKRLVAEDATLANLCFSAKLKKAIVQKIDATGNLLYLDAAGKETTDATITGTPANTSHLQIRFACESVVGAKTLKDVQTTMTKKLNVPTSLEEEATIPLFLITDNGRGLSKKKIRISPNYAKSKNKGCMKYILDVIENNAIIESQNFTLDHNFIDTDDNNKSIETVIRENSYQLNAKVFEDYFDAFIERAAEITGYDEEYLYQNDLLFGYDKANTASTLPDITVDLTNGFNLSFVYGIDLSEGTNGSFGTVPFGTQAWTDSAIEFFDGTFSTKIYDLYNAQFGVAIDANYPLPVKTQIEALAMFREDFLFLRDSGTKLTNLDEIIDYNDIAAQTKFSVLYGLSYNIKDPNSRKEVTVTVGYSLARLMINHFRYGRNRPLAGIIHEFTIPEAIENTINFMPSVTPSIDEKKEMEDARINYGSYFGNVLTLETFWTAQKESTELSFANNILAIQQVMQAIRIACPKNRYTLLTENDLSNYERAVNDVINTYAGNFDKIKMEYAEDEAAIDEKVYYAIIKCVFKNFVNAEKFRLIALPIGSSVA